MGRAGRDRKEALGTLMFNQQDAVEYIRIVLRDKQLTPSMRRRELFQTIELIQFCTRNCCLQAQLQQYFCGFNIVPCKSRCSKCKDNKELQLVNLSDLV